MDVGGSYSSSMLLHPDTNSSRNKDWVVLIKEGLKQHAQNKRSGPKQNPEKVLRRVRRQLRELKPEHYAAEEFSFGLFDRPPLGSPGSKGIGEQCKLLMATAVLGVMGLTEDDWETFCKKVVPNPEETQNFYDELGRDLISPQEVQSVLTLDAIFLAGFLGSQFHVPFKIRFPTLKTAIDSTTARTILHTLIKDLFKVENQIPLSLIHRVLLLLSEKVYYDKDVERRKLELVEGTLKEICEEAVCKIGCVTLPGRNNEGHCPTDGIPFLECDHFLQCMYYMMCQGLDPGSRLCPEEGEASIENTEQVILPTVSELQKAGIQFQGVKGPFHDIEFKEGILYLPILRMGEDHEAFWRNLVAYEDILYHADVKPTYYMHEFTNYLDLMDKLIEDPNDVAVLKSGKSPVVLGNGLGSNEAMARIFNNTVLQNCFVEPAKYERWQLLHNKIHAFYIEDRRRLYVEFMESYFGKPWLTISVVVATMLLIMTILQTIYTVAQYYEDEGESQSLASILR